jgi:ubiquinone/menaquinone biosynthesis C-methylase UbiE
LPDHSQDAVVSVNNIQLWSDRAVALDECVRVLVSGGVLVVLFRYPGFTPLIVLTLAFDPVMRFVASRILSVTSTRTPPGAKLNAPAFVVLTLLFIASIA